MKVIFKNLTKVFINKKTKKKVYAVNDLDVELPDGKLVGLLGPSGCGKSTTLYMVAGLQTPTSGEIYFGDTNVTNLPVEKREIGLVFQNYALYPHMTVEQNIMFPLLNMHIKKALAKQKAYEVAKLVQIENYLDRKPNELSGGQQQRVAIARALVKTPDVLLLDEPLSNLDARLRLQTREEIKRIQQEAKVTTIFVTHDQEEAMSISDVIIVMKDGIMQQMDEPQKVYDDPKNLFVAQFLGTPPINTFIGKIEDGNIIVNEEIIGKSNKENQDIYVGIRPEGFIIDDNGLFSVELKNIEVMGRDLSIIATNPACTKETIRFIINSDNILPSKKELKLSIKSNKMFIFNKETQERIYD